MLTESLEGHGYYSEEAESADFSAGDYAARDTRANDGLLKLWSFGGAPEEIHLVAAAWSESGSVGADEWTPSPPGRLARLVHPPPKQGRLPRPSPRIDPRHSPCTPSSFFSVLTYLTHHAKNR